jgi:hypothetical protein
MAPRPFTTALAVAAALSAAGARARAQSPRMTCQVSHQTLVQTESDHADPAVAPALAFTAEGALVMHRGRNGGLWLHRLDAQLHALGEARELTSEAGAFALIESTDGVVAVYVERGQEIVLARVSARGEAQNVPRVLARAATTVRAVAITRTPEGFVLAWTVEGESAVRALATDTRGVPRGEAQAVAAGAAPRIEWLQGVAVAALAMGAPGDDPAVVQLSPSGEVIARTRWAAGVLGPVELGGGVYFVHAHTTGVPVLERVPVGGIASGFEVGALTASRVHLNQVISDGASAAVLTTDLHAQRQFVYRLAPDGTASAPALVRSNAQSPASMGVRRDGVFFVVTREAGAHNTARIAATLVTCAR